MRPLLEVIAITAGDARGAVEGGADRLQVVADVEADDAGGLTPTLELVESLRQECDLPLRVVLRGSAGFSTSGSELSRLKGAARQFTAAGVDGFVLGFLGPGVEIDVDATMDLVEELDGLPWTFHRAVDHALDVDRAWRTLRELPGLSDVLTAGSARGLAAGLDDLCARTTADPWAAALVLAGGGLQPEHVPWLARAGVRKYHVGSPVRPGGSWKAYVDAGLVRSWRSLIDDAVAAVP